jgi:hypothetical protein
LREEEQIMTATFQAAPIQAAIDSAIAVRRINDTLQGPVVEVLGQFLPELKGMPRSLAFERMLDDLDLLSRCFATFRSQRERFRFVVVDGHHHPVAEDDIPLACGRTLAEVVAMVVRTAAKRHFRRCLAPSQQRPVSRRLRAGTPATAPAAKSPADELYDAIKDYLLHEWQVPLVPSYAGLQPAMVRRLGARLLDCREPEALARLVAEPDAANQNTPAAPKAIAAIPAAGAPPSPPSRYRPVALTEVLTPDGLKLRAEAFTSIMLDPQVRAAMGNVDQTLRIGEMLRGVGARPAGALLEGLQLRKDQLAVMLTVAHQCVGAEVFSRLFGPEGEPALVARIVERAKAGGIVTDTALPDCASFTRSLFARFRNAAAKG